MLPISMLISVLASKQCLNIIGFIAVMKLFRKEVANVSDYVARSLGNILSRKRFQGRSTDYVVIKAMFCFFVFNLIKER